jgi:hypothetical protein
MRVKERCELGGFMLEREGSESAQDERQDEDGEQKADCVKELGSGLKRGHLWNGSLPIPFSPPDWTKRRGEIQAKRPR